MVLFLGITSPPQPLTIVTEFCGGGSLYDLINSDLKIDFDLQVRLLFGVAKGMYHLHRFLVLKFIKTDNKSEGVIHRDLAARNVLMTVNIWIFATDMFRKITK